MGNRILIIDDEVQLRGLLSRIISLEGYEVVEAGDCRTGLKQLESFAPEVVLCDVRLPDGNGVEMVEKIRQAAPQTEVILLTAYGNIPDGVQAIKNGAFDYITKGDDNNKRPGQAVVRGRELFRIQQRTARKRTVRTPCRSLYRGRQGQERAVRGGFRRDDFFGRDRRDGVRLAGQAAARDRPTAT